MASNDIPGISIVALDKSQNPLIARGAFGHVDIALLAQWTSSLVHLSTSPMEKSVSLAAIKTIPNATISSKSTQLTREVFAELNALRLLNGHDNVTALLGFYSGQDGLSSKGGGFGGWDWADDSCVGETPTSLCLVFPYHPIDLSDSLSYRRLNSFASGSPHQSFYLPQVVIQSVMHDILSALRHIHEHRILHRDIKPANLYITNSGRIQVGDFGLAKPVVPTHADTSLCDEKGLCTLQYRPPELLLGGTGIIHQSAKQDRIEDDEDGVNGALDIWSTGCIFVELLTLSGPLFPGKSVLDQLGRIFHVLGTPTNDSWPGVSSLPDWNKVNFEPIAGCELQETIIGQDLWDKVGELLTKMLSLDPLQRPSAKQCLSHAFCSISDRKEKAQAYQSVVNELIPSSLQIASPMHFTPPSTNKVGDGNGKGYSADLFGYAKQYASILASSRRSFPQSINEATNESNGRWKCS